MSREAQAGNLLRGVKQGSKVIRQAFRQIQEQPCLRVISGPVSTPQHIIFPPVRGPHDNKRQYDSVTVEPFQSPELTTCGHWLWSPVRENVPQVHPK